MHLPKKKKFKIEKKKKKKKIGFKVLIPQNHKAHLHYNINHEFIFYHFDFKIYSLHENGYILKSSCLVASYYKMILCQNNCNNDIIIHH